jgi:DNA-3-methyladenine glycosylase II
MSDADIERTLTAVPGIGTWTVQGFLVIALDRPDAFPAGDLGIRRAVRDLYGLGALPGEEEVRSRAEAWRPYRALAAGYLISWDAMRRSGRVSPPRP